MIGTTVIALLPIVAALLADSSPRSIRAPLLIIGGKETPVQPFLREWLSTLPSLTTSELSEIESIYAAAHLGEGPDQRPIRAPHYTVTSAGLVGTVDSKGDYRPGEASLAHTGVLLLDDVSEFSKSSMDALLAVHRAGEVQEGRWRIPGRVHASGLALW